MVVTVLVRLVVNHGCRRCNLTGHGPSANKSLSCCWTNKRRSQGPVFCFVRFEENSVGFRCRTSPAHLRHSAASWPVTASCARTHPTWPENGPWLPCEREHGTGDCRRQMTASHRNTDDCMIAGTKNHVSPHALLYRKHTPNTGKHTQPSACTQYTHTHTLEHMLELQHVQIVNAAIGKPLVLVHVDPTHTHTETREKTSHTI